MGEAKNVRTASVNNLRDVPDKLCELLQEWGVSPTDIWRAKWLQIEINKDTGRGNVYMVMK